MFSETIISDPLFSFATLAHTLPPTMTVKNTCENEVECLNIAQLPCHHCPKRLCLKHVMHHNKLNIERADELSNELNSLKDFLSNCNSQQSFQAARNKLNKWKTQSFDDIENTYAFHSDEINRLEQELNHRLDIFKEDLRSKFSSLHTQLATLQKCEEISHQQLSPIESNLSQLRQYLESVRCEISVKTKNISFDHLIDEHNVFSYNCILSNNTLTKPYQIIPVKDIKMFASSKKNQSILWCDTQGQLHYIDQKLQTHRLTMPQTMCYSGLPASSVLSDDQPRTKVVDIKWCSSAEVFLILFHRYLISFEPKTGKCTQIPIVRYKDYPFRSISCLNDTSLYISYCTSGICIELWKYPYDNMNDNYMDEPVKRWDCLTNDKTDWVIHMDTNSSAHLGLLIRKGSSIHTRFELRDESLVLWKKVQFHNDFIESIFPFRYHQWFIKSSSGKYYVYSTETNEYQSLSFEFPFGFQEFGTNSIVIGNKQEELMLFDV